MSITKPLLLVDGSSYFFRAFHALPPLLNSAGHPTGAIYGVANMIKRLIKDYQPEYLAVVFDAKGKTFRDELYPDYKAHRPPMPSELTCQFQPLIDVLTAMGLPLLIIPGVEADDVIGTIAHLATLEARPVVVSTGDKDMAQLVNEHISLVNTMTNKTMDVDGVKEKFGVTPEQIIDYLTLIGDTSDNIPGVNKCGPKTAVKWLSEYQTLDNLIAHADDIGGKIGEYLRASLAQIPLSKKLVTIKTDVELPLSLDELKPKPVNRQELLSLAQTFEFKSWVKELSTKEHTNLHVETVESQSLSLKTPSKSVPGDNNHELHQVNSSSTSLTNEFKYDVITEKHAFDELLKQLKSSTLFCLSTETTHTDAVNAEIIGISLVIDIDHVAYIPLAHNDESTQLPREMVLLALKPLLEDPYFKKVGHNLKHDYSVFKNYDITICGIAYDTMLESYLLNSASSRHDLETLAFKYLQYKTIPFTEVVGRGVKQRSFDQVTVNEAAFYASEKAWITLRLHQKIYPMLAAPLQTVLNEIEIPLLTVLADMERHGVLIDTDLLANHGLRLKEEILNLEQQAIAIVGLSFNLNSPKQLQTILYDEQKLPILSKTPTGQPSTAEAVLLELAEKYELPAVILKYRSLSKLVSTYIDALPKKVNCRTHRVHTSYNQAVTATGRLSSSDPNLQNIPIRSEEGRLIRKAFIAPPQHVLLTADYSQIELRIMAHLSQDPGLLRAFAEGLDIHVATASDIFKTPLHEVTQEQRRRAKAVNFGLIYGMSAFGLAKQLQVERHVAEHYINSYFERYPGVLLYMERSRAQAHEHGYVETIFGRRLYLPEINAKSIMRQKAAERTAINAPLQGTAADIIKKAMLEVAKWQNQSLHSRLNQAGECTTTHENPFNNISLPSIKDPRDTSNANPVEALMIMQVHDELVFEVKNSAIEQVKNTVREIMEHTVEISVPLLVSIGVGDNWDEAH